MSTTFYELREPWSSIRVEETPGHARITLWNDGGLAGTLTVKIEDLGPALGSFRGDDFMVRSSRTYRLMRSENPLPRSRKLICEYNEIHDAESMVERLDPEAVAVYDLPWE